MEKHGKLSDKEAALIALAKREVAASRNASGAQPTPPALPAQSAGSAPPPRPRQTASPAPAVPVTAKLSAGPTRVDAALGLDEQMALLMAEEATKNRRRQKRLSLYLLMIPLAVLIAAFIWVLVTTLPRLR